MMLYKEAVKLSKKYNKNVENMCNGLKSLADSYGCEFKINNNVVVIPLKNRFHNYSYIELFINILTLGLYRLKQYGCLKISYDNPESRVISFIFKKNNKIFVHKVSDMCLITTKLDYHLKPLEQILKKY